MPSISSSPPSAPSAATPAGATALPSQTALFEQMADAVYLLDPASSDIVWCNRAAWQVLGLTPEQVLNHSVLSLQMDVTGLPAWSEIAAVIRSAPPYTFVGRHRHASGHELPVEVVTTAFVDGGREYFLSVARDITRRLALEADLNQREKQLWFALNEASDGLWDWNVTTGEVFFSPQLKRMLGYGPEEMPPVLETWSGNVHPDDKARVLAVLGDHLEGRRVRYEAEYRLRNRSGHWHWVHDRGRVCDRDAAGRATRVVGMVHDITARREAADELERHRHRLQELVDERTAALVVARDAAEAASRAKSRFLANMSHELRTPLAAVMGMNTVARRARSDEAMRDALGKADQAAHHLLEVINDILDLSKIEAERMTLEQGVFDLGALVDEVAVLASPSAERSGLAFSVELPDALRRQSLVGDTLRLKQMLLNLVGNAMKFTPEGRVSLRITGQPVADARLDLRFEVEDTGIGIAPEALSRLFNPFEQADNSMTRRYGGTGLGLAISRRLALMMGGDIGVRSEPGQGSCFWVTVALPLAAGAAAAAESPAADGTLTATGLPLDPQPSTPLAAQAALRLQRHAGKRVLLAEDEPVNREVVMHMLTQGGLVVDAVEDGQLALQRLHDHDYALVLMDMQMPRMNGIDAARAMRADAHAPRIPILAITANVYEEDRRACLAAGMDAHIGKPFTAEALFTAVASLLDAPPR